MTPERRQELRAKSATNQHGLEPSERLELLDDNERLSDELQNSRLDVLHMKALLEEAANRESTLVDMNKEADRIVAYLRKLGFRHVAAAIQDGKHLEET